MSRAARLKIRPETGQVLSASGKPVEGVKLVNGTTLVRLPEVGRSQRDFVRDLALVATGKTGLTTEDVIALHDLRRRARRAAQSPSETWAELLDQIEERPRQQIDLTKSHLRTPVRQRPGRSVTALAALAPEPPRGTVSMSIHDRGLVRDRRGKPVDGARFNFSTGKFVRVQKLADELATLQAQEDQIAERQDADAADAAAAEGLAAFGRRLLGTLGRIADRPEPVIASAPAPVIHVTPAPVNVTVPAPVVHVQAPEVRVPDVHVRVEQPPRAASVRLEIADDGTRRFVTEDADEEKS
jgi:hypothetical protein